LKKLKKKVLIFDVDGVLIDSKKNMELSWNKVQKKHNLNNIVFEKYFKNIGRPFFKILNIIGIRRHLKKIKKTYQQESIKQIKEIKFYKNAKKTIEDLKSKNYILNIVTSKDLNRTKKSIKDIKNNFTYIECSKDRARGKPFPDQINLIISKLKVNKSECVYIGDTLVDYNTAKNAKIDFIFAKWGYGANYNYKYQCKDIKDLIKLIIKV
jgi:phosphoglycolate phosphatase